MKDNYAAMQDAAQKRFCTYDMAKIAAKNGVTETQRHICTTFLGQKVQIDKSSGSMTLDGRTADFPETLTVFDWLCDADSEAAASGAFCTVSSLPGIFVSGSGLVMNNSVLAAQIDGDPGAFRAACEAMGGKQTGSGDIGFQIPVFPDLQMQLKFYHADEDFPAALTFLWDSNTLRFIRYETVYYLARCLRQRLLYLL